MENLPTNLLLNIFGYLGSSDVIAISCCCKKFLEVTTDFMAIKYPPIRIDFQYLDYSNLQKFTYRDGKDFNALISTTRHYQNYMLLNFNKEHTDRLGNKWLKLFKRQINARTLRIKSDCLELQQLSNILKLTHRLIYLEIDGYRFAKTGDRDVECDVAHLPSLKHLRINSFLNTSPQLFKIFQECRTLKTISLSALLMVSKQIKPVNDLIFNQSELEQLEIIGLDTHNGLFKYDQCPNEMPCKLKKLNIEYNGYSINLEKFCEFFVQQKSLKEVKLALDLRNSLNPENDHEICERIIHHCMLLENLSSLNILTNKYAQKNLDTNRQDFPKSKCKRLIFENESRDNNNLIIALLKALPKLRFLELACEYDNDILQSLSHINKLKHLKLTDYNQGLLNRIKCSENLESIALKYCYTRNSGPDWHVFLNDHPNIKKIHIDHSIDFIDDAIIELIAGACKENLEYFAMCDSVAKNVSDQAFISFQRHCPNVKYLKITENPSKRAQNKHQTFHDMLANIKCVILFYIICIILFVVLIFLMVFEKI